MDVEGRTMSEEALTHPKYRPDIDGLRAIAVLSVLGYHAFPEWIHGGFIGVDIFFVISGFLISTIIFKSLSSNEFSFIEFYSRRVRRIFPALATVLLTVFVVGWFILYPDEYRQLGKHILGGAGFISNFVLWKESGYFDSAAEMKPLLHLWSLGIEEQFYIVFPLFAWLAWKYRLNLLTLVIVVGLPSFLLNVKYISTDAIWTFYQPQTRFWELMIGSLLALLVIDTSGRIGNLETTLDRFASKVLYRQDVGLPPGTALANSKAWLGALLLAVALYRINREFHFPGKWAAVPTIGAALLIWAGPRAFVNRCVLSNPVFVWVGKISYPLYLWHWVILSYLRILTSGTPLVEIRSGAIIAAIVLSWLTYRFIETPLRFGNGGRKKTIGLVAIMIAIAAVGFASFKIDQFGPFSVIMVKNGSAEILQALGEAKQHGLLAEASMRERCFQWPPDKDFEFFIRHNCTSPSNEKKNSPVIFLIGDSHSASLSTGVKPWVEAKGFNFYQISSGSCSLFSDDASDGDCQTYSRRTFELVKVIKPDVLLINLSWRHASDPVFYKNLGHWPNYTDYLMDRFRFIAGLGAKKVIVVGQVPTWKTDLPKVLIQQFVLRGQGVPEKSLLELEPLSLDMDAKMRNLDYPTAFRYISLTDMLCDSTGCMTKVGPNLLTDLVVWDYGHLTAAGAKFVMDRRLGSMITEALGEPRKN